MEGGTREGGLDPGDTGIHQDLIPVPSPLSSPLLSLLTYLGHNAIN